VGALDRRSAAEGLLVAPGAPAPTLPDRLQLGVEHLLEGSGARIRHVGAGLGGRRGGGRDGVSAGRCAGLVVHGTLLAACGPEPASGPRPMRLRRVAVAPGPPAPTSNGEVLSYLICSQRLNSAARRRVSFGA
jgi:hypothetical protein